MPLTSNQIAEILTGLGHTRAANNLEKRRRAIRVRHRDEVTVIPYTEGVPNVEKPARLIDFSSRGVAIRFSLPMSSGSHFVLLLPRQQQRPIRILCAVAHCKSRPDHCYSIGAEFVGLAPDELSNQNKSEAARIASSILD